MKKLTTWICVLLLLLLCGCKGSTVGRVLRYDIGSAVTNLDPQFTTDATARMVIDNIYEGLVVLDADGAVQPGAAESYTVSPDRLVYTFALREDGKWSNGDPVVAGDFVFAFRRMFRTDVPSPHAADYSAILNAGDILAGSQPNTQLGVHSNGDYQVEITLSRADPTFLEKLAAAPAVPCNENFFNESRGRYGLELDYICSNGPLSLTRWDDTRLQLRPEDDYHSYGDILSGGVNLFVGRDSKQQFLDGNSDLAFFSYEDYDSLDLRSTAVEPIYKTTWCIVFNQNHYAWKSPLLRQGLAQAIDYELLGDGTPQGFSTTSLLVPDAIRIGGLPYRDYGAETSPLTFDTQQARYLFDLGLDLLELDQVPSTYFYVPEFAVQSMDMGTLQQSWQRYLQAYINFEVASPAQIQDKFRTGDYQMLLLPFTPSDSRIETLLTAFRSDSSQNYFGYESPVYDQMLQSALEQETLEEGALRYAQAEIQLLSDAVIIPLYSETTYLAIRNDIQQLEISSFGDRIHFWTGERVS